MSAAVKINLQQRIKSVFNYKYNIKYSINTNNTYYIKQGSKSKKPLMSQRASQQLNNNNNNN